MDGSAGLHDPGRAAGQYHALVIQAAHQHLDAAVLDAEHVLLRHLDVIEEQLAGVGATHAELVELVAAGKTFPVALDDERGDAVRPLVQVGLGVDHVGVGVRAVGDPGLAAVEHVAVAALFGAQLHGDHVGTGIRLAHGQRADVFAADQLGQVAGLLLGVAVAVDLVDAQVGVGAVGKGDRGRAAADLFHRHHVGQVAKAGAAVLLGDGHAEQTHLAEFLPHVGREQVVLVDGLGARRQLGGDERLDLLAQHVDGFTEGEIEAGVVHGATCLSCNCSVFREFVHPAGSGRRSGRSLSAFGKWLLAALR